MEHLNISFAAGSGVITGTGEGVAVGVGVGVVVAVTVAVGVITGGDAAGLAVPGAEPVMVIDFTPILFE